MFKVIGIEKIIQPETAMQDIAALWDALYEILEHVDGAGTYAVYDNYEGNFMKPYRYLVGKRVRGDHTLTQDEIKAGLSLREVPEGKYEVVKAKGRMPLALIDQWKMIWGNKEGLRSYRVDYEEYKNDSEVDIYLGVN